MKNQTVKKNSKKTIPKKTAVPKRTSQEQLKNIWLKKVTGPIRNLQARRPHRSFQRTRRRDYVRSLNLPGYWSFTFEVLRELRKNKRHFSLLVITYAVLTAALVGVSSQETYSQLSGILQTPNETIFGGGWGEFGKAGLLLLAGFTGSFSPELSESQQIYSAFLLLFTWLTTVWLLRALMAGSVPRLRDAIYNAGAPVIPTVLVSFVLILQLLPIAIAVIAYAAAVATDFLSIGAIAMVFWIAASLLALLSLYWITSTLIALVVVTLPGMYPMQALRTAGDLVIGRRIRILLRLVWLFASTALLWVVVVIPIIVIDNLIKSAIPSVQWVPLVPIVVVLVTSTAAVWSASYIYILYRKVVEDDADPA